MKVSTSFLRRAMLIAGLTTAAAACAAPLPWQVGVARAKITPTAALWMTGLAARDHPAEGTAQDLWVKALAVQDPQGRAGVLLTLDLCGITREISDFVAAEIERRKGLPRSAVMTNVSHTHCSPWLPGNLIGLRVFPAEELKLAADYRQFLQAQMIRAALAALDSLAPATLSWGEDTAPFAMNRRNNREAEGPALRAAGELRGPVDDRVPVLVVRSLAGDVRAILVSYACHNTTLAFYQWHGDYAGCAQAELERRYPGAIALFALGCAGNINPNPRRTVELAEKYGGELADAVDRAVRHGLQPVEGGFSSALEDITLAFARKPTPQELRDAPQKDAPGQSMYRAWSAAVTEQLRTRGDAVLIYRYPIQTWRLGGLTWAALGGEVVVDYGLRLRAEIPGNLWVFGYSNDVMAYIPNESILREGGYEGATSMVAYGRPGPWAPGLEAKIMGKTRELVAAVRK